MKKEELNNLLDTVAGIFLRCFLLSFSLLLLWFVLYLAAGDWTYTMQSGWFDLSRRDFALVNYYGMVFTKISIILFFLFPYVSIKLVLRKK